MCVCVCVYMFVELLAKYVSNSFCHVNSMVVPGKRDQIHVFLSLTEDPAFGILPPADLVGSVQPIYNCGGICLPVGNKSDFCYSISPLNGPNSSSIYGSNQLLSIQVCNSRSYSSFNFLDTGYSEILL